MIFIYTAVMTTTKALLNKHDLKATPKRLAILNILARTKSYMSPEEIWKQMKIKFNKIGLPTVYRNLDELTQAHIIDSIIRPNRQLYYFYCQASEHHHHFVCDQCRNVIPVHCCNLPQLKKYINQHIGGLINHHIIQISGLCRNCMNSSKSEKIK